MNAGDTSSSLPTHIAVCICTCRRPKGLTRLLSALCNQVFGAKPPLVSIIVADNEINPVNREICEALGRNCQHRIEYIEARPSGISHARNACLNHLPGDCSHVAMIDDDEIPSEGWLDALLQAQLQTGADVVAGPTLASFESGAPEWLSQSGWFDKPPHPGNYRNLEPFPPTATCNVLLKSSIFTADSFRFDPALALSGSEDKLLFQDLKLQGYKFVWAADALVREHVPPDRARLAYAFAEAIRRGSTKFYVKSMLKAPSGTRRLRLAVRSAARALTGIGRHGLSAVILLTQGKRNRHKLANHLLDAAENLGFLAGIFGYRRKHYHHRSHP